MAKHCVTLECGIAPLQSAVQVASDGGFRIKWDYPESEMDKLAEVLAARECTVKQVLEWDDDV